MNLEIILAFIVGALIGGFATFKLLPGFLKSIFRDTARDELSEIQQEINDEDERVRRIEEEYMLSSQSDEYSDEDN